MRSSDAAYSSSSRDGPRTYSFSTVYAAATAAASADAVGGATTVPRYGSKSLSIAFTASNTANCVIAAKRAWTTGPSPPVVLTMIAFHSSTGSLDASAVVESSRPHTAAAIRVRVLITMTPYVNDVRNDSLVPDRSASSHKSEP